MKLLTAKKQAVIPQYLQVACEELRVFGVFEELTAHLKSLPENLPQLLQAILTRLETDHGQQLVATAMTLLASSRQGQSMGNGIFLSIHFVGNVACKA